MSPFRPFGAFFLGPDRIIILWIVNFLPDAELFNILPSSARGEQLRPYLIPTSDGSISSSATYEFIHGLAARLSFY